MASQLIESLSTDFEPDKYRDEYREELLALIERKARGEEVVEAVSEEPKPTKAPDLMAALEESLAAVKGEPLAAGSKRDGAKRDGSKRSQADRPSEVRLRLQAEDQIEIAKQGQSREVDVDGHRLELTNLDKVLWPETGFTKGQAIDYYARIADAILPHLARPAADPGALSRTASTRSASTRSAALHTARLGQDRPGLERRATRATSTTAVCNDRATLIWLAQLAALELHPSLSLAKDDRAPDRARLRPRPRASRRTSSTAAGSRCASRELFGGLEPRVLPEDLGVEGAPGLRPAEHARSPTSETKPFAHAVAQALERAEPDTVVSRMARSCARARSSSTGARTTSTRRRSPSTRCGRASSPPSRPRWSGSEVEGAAEREDPESLASRRPRCSSEWRSAATCSSRCWS